MYFELLSTRRQNFLRETRQPEPVTCTALEFFSGNLTPEAFLMQANIPRFFFLPIRYQVVRWWCSKWSQWWHDPSHQHHLQLQSVCRHLSRSIQLAGRRRPGRGWHDWIFKYFGRWLVIILIGLTSTMWSKVSQHFDVGSQQSGWRDWDETKDSWTKLL